MFLPACATKQLPEPVLGFPYELAQDCEETPVRLETNGDIVLAYRSARSDLRACNADKAGLREWATDNGLAPAMP